VVLGALSTLAVPSAIVATHVDDRIDLLESLYVGVAAGLALALASILLRRSARKAARRSVRPNESGLRTAKWLGWLGLYVGLMGALSIGFYEVLKQFE
jgi:hypothetical protein